MGEAMKGRASFWALLMTALPASALAQFQAAPLPDGPGKELVETTCTVCHMSYLITSSSGYTKDGWRELTGTMIDLSRAPDTEDKIFSYLAEHFPPNTKRAPKLVPGAFKITFKEWVVPKLGQRARDPVEAPDGKIWWVGQVGNVDHENITVGKAGRSRWKGRRPHVRGVVMNPVDHPHGGGEGKSGQGNPHPVSPWGLPTKGYKTRNNKRTEKFRIARRK